MTAAARGVWALIVLVAILLGLAFAVPFLSAGLVVDLVATGWEAGR